MRFSDIRIQHIYSVDFGNGERCEFNNRHLAVVLKKNADQRTLIVVPLTTSNNGLGTTKQLLGKISNLPPNLSVNDTYFVYDQVRTLNANRFYALKNNGQIHQTKLDDHLFTMILKFCSKEFVKSFSHEEKTDFYLLLSKESICEHIIDLAYQARKSNDSSVKDEKNAKILELFQPDLPFSNILTPYNHSSKIMDDINLVIEEEIKSKMQ